MTNECRDNFQVNMQTIAAFAGLAPLPKQLQTKECPNCDMEEGVHQCIVCGWDIAEKGCKSRDGHCVDCYSDLQWSLKH